MSGNKQKIAFQGYAGAYSDLACRAVCPDMETLPCNSFEDAFAAVRDGLAAKAMIPVDNTLAGRVADVHHLLPAGGLYITAEHFQPIHHALLGVAGSKIEDLKHVHSHVHAIPQCRNMIKKLGLQPHVHADTAGAAAEAAQRGDKQHGAIASTLAAEIYGLDILEGDVQDADHNTTRFLLLAPEPEIPAYKEDGHYLTSIVYRVRNIPAALYKTLGGFATNGVSMAKLESYVGAGFNVAQFYAELEGHPDSRAFQLAMEELEFYAKEVNVLGTYKAHTLRQQATL
ncbi:MAG: prephenate dehydratase [Rhodospirillales bacterium]|nr:prephenate dehydratase [Rhodospirillales bacterium]MCB9996133.1 prephenate dehydratase [Rhodospirillales bacterium]